MNHQIIQECVHLSEQGKITFPEVVQKLLGAGVELYYVDFLASKATYYGKNEAYAVDCNYSSKREVAPDFNETEVVHAIRLIQSGQIQYQEFVGKMMAAGVISYLSCLEGAKVTYFGRKGEEHIEKFTKK